MAAVICQSVGKVCSGFCNCIGAVCTAPCKLCGAACEGCGQCCSESCKLVTNCCSTSFCFYITVTVALNLPPIAVGLMDLPNVIGGCTGSIWLLVFWLLCAVNIVAAFYMSVAIQKDDSIMSGDVEGGMSHFQENARNGAGRIKHLFCYDVWMAGYILALFGFFVWLLLGAAWFATGTMDDSESCDSINGRVGIAYAFGWAFLFCGGCALCTSLCCSVCDRSPRFVPGSQPQHHQAQSQNTPAATASVPATSDDKFGSTIAAHGKPEPPSAPSDPEELPMAEAVLISGDNDYAGKKE